MALLKHRQAKTFDGNYNLTMIRILGTAQLGGTYGILSTSVGSSGDEPVSHLRTAHDLSFSALDTAPAYPDSETLIGEFGQAFEIHTKFQPGIDPESSLKSSLRKLKRDQVEIAYLHDPNAALIDGGHAVRQADNLKGQYFNKLGTTVYSRDALLASLDFSEIQVVQIPANPLWKTLINMIPGPAPRETLIFARSLLAQGLLVAETSAMPRSVEPIQPYILSFQSLARDLGRSPLEVALLWSRDHPNLDGLVIGAGSISQLVAISRALDSPALTLNERMLIEGLEQPDPTLMDPRNWV